MGGGAWAAATRWGCGDPMGFRDRSRGLRGFHALRRSNGLPEGIAPKLLRRPEEHIQIGGVYKWGLSRSGGVAHTVQGRTLWEEKLARWQSPLVGGRRYISEHMQLRWAYDSEPPAFDETPMEWSLPIALPLNAFAVGLDAIPPLCSEPCARTPRHRPLQSCHPRTAFDVPAEQLLPCPRGNSAP